MRRKIPIVSLVGLLIALPVLAGPAEKAYKKKDLGKARRLYEDRLRDYPDDQRARYDLGNVLYRSSDLRSAEEAWRAALRSEDPRVRSRAAHNLGNAELQSGRLPDAIGSYIEALRTEPGNPDSKYNLELALRMLQEQQKQQKQQQQQGQSGRQNQQQKQQEQQKQQPEGERNRQDQSKPQEQSQPQNPRPPAPGDYSREQAERVLDGLKQEEQKLLADRLRSQGTDLRVEKDW